MTDGPLVEEELIDGVAVVRLNHPATLNALSFAMVDGLQRALDRAEKQARALILTGNGRSFCSGANLSGGFAYPYESEEERDCGKPLETHFNPLLARLRALSIPWISAVNGTAAGGGAALALSADMVVAAEYAAFIQVFSRIGLVPDGGSFHMLVRTIGRVRANELMLLGGRLPAAQAAEWGLVNRLCPPDQLLPVALEIAGQLTAGPASLSTIRALSWMALDADFHTMLWAERAAQKESGRTADFREGVAAFLEKRPARFVGK